MLFPPSQTQAYKIAPQVLENVGVDSLLPILERCNSVVESRNEAEIGFMFNMLGALVERHKNPRNSRGVQYLGGRAVDNVPGGTKLCWNFCIQHQLQMTAKFRLDGHQPDHDNCLCECCVLRNFNGVNA